MDKLSFRWLDRIPGLSDEHRRELQAAVSRRHNRPFPSSEEIKNSILRLYVLGYQRFDDLDERVSWADILKDINEFNQS